MNDPKLIPNSFQTPNHYVDDVMELVTPEEFKCLVFAVRHIYGWRDKIAKKRGRISMSAFTDGYLTKDGKRYGGTGLGYDAVSRALDGLVTHGLLIRVGTITQDGQEWEIGSQVRVDLLLERREAARDARKKQTTKARRSRTSGLSDRVPETSVQQSTEVVCLTEDQTSVQQSTGGLSDRGKQTHSQTHDQTKEILAPVGAAPDGALTDSDSLVWLAGDDPAFDVEAAPELYACTPAEINALIAAWWEWVPTRPTKRGKVVAVKEHFANGENRAYAENLIQRGVAPADFIRVLGDMRINPESRWKHLREKPLTFCYVAPIVEEWVQTERAAEWYTPDAPRITPRRPDVTLDLGEIEDGANLLERYRNHPDFLVDVPRPYLLPVVDEEESDEAARDTTDDESLLSTIGVPL